MKVGDTFIVQYQVVAECDADFEYRGQRIGNTRRNLFWAVPVGDPNGERMLVCSGGFSEEYDPFMQGIKEFNLKPLDGTQLKG